MKISVPVGYTASVKAPRKVNAINESFFEWVNIEIRDINPDDAPIAAEWRDSREFISKHLQGNYWYAYLSARLIADDGQDFTRWYEGQHWWPVLDKVNRDEVDDGVFRHNAKTFQDKWRKHHLGYPMVKSNLNWRIVEEFPDGRPLDLGDYRSVEDNTFAEELERLRKSADNLIFIDGQLYERLPEPVYVLTYPSISTGHYDMVIRVVPNAPEYLPEKLHVYGLDQFEDALDAANLRFRARGNKEEHENINAGREATVFIEDAFQCDTDIQRAQTAAEKIVSNTKDRKIHSFSRDEGISYLNLVQAFDILKETGDFTHLLRAADEYLLVLGQETESPSKNLLETISRGLGCKSISLKYRKWGP